MKSLILWINHISKDDNRKGAYKVDKNKPSNILALKVGTKNKVHEIRGVKRFLSNLINSVIESITILNYGLAGSLIS